MSTWKPPADAILSSETEWTPPSDAILSSTESETSSTGEPRGVRTPFAEAPSPSSESPSSVSPSTSVGVVGQSVAPDGQRGQETEMLIRGGEIANRYIKSSQDFKQWRDYKDALEDPMAAANSRYAEINQPDAFNQNKKRKEQANYVYSAFEKSHKQNILDTEKYINEASNKYVSSDSKIGQAQAKLLMKQASDGTLVPDEGKIRTIAEDESRKLGVEGTEFEKLYYNKLKQKVDNAFIRPSIESLYEEKAKNIYDRYSLKFTEDDKLYASSQARLQSLKSSYVFDQEEIRKQYETEIAPISEQIKIENQQLEQGYNQSYASIQERYNSGLIDSDSANAELAQLNESFKKTAEEYDKKRNALQEQILQGYNARFSELNKNYNSLYDAEVSAFNKENASIVQKWSKDPELKKQLEQAYEDSYKTVTGSIKGFREELANPYTALFDSYLKTTGGVIKSMSAAFGEDIGPMYELGDWLENRYFTKEVDMGTFKSWLPGQGLGTLTGQLAATMIPSVGAATLASTGFGTPAAAAMAGGLTSAVMNAWQVSGSAREDVFNETGDAAAADKAGTETLKSQIAYLPLSFAEAMPFVKGLSMLPSKLASKLPASLTALEKPIQMGAKGVFELGVETIQEKFEGSTEKSVLEGGGAFDRLGQDLKDINDWKKTLVAVGPAGFIGAVGGVSEPTRSGLANEFLAQRAADKVNDSYKNAWVLKGVFENPSMARASIDLMFANGSIDQNERDALRNRFDSAIKNKEQAERLGLDGQRQYIYTAMSGELDGLRAKLEAEQDPVAKKVLEDRMKTASQGLVDFANNKGGAYYTITMTNGVPMVQTEEGMTRLLGDQQFIDGALGSSNISIQSFGKADPAVQKRVQELIKKQQQLKTQTDAVQKRTAAQMGAQPLGPEGAREEGGEGVGPGVQGPKAPETLTEEEVAVVAPGRSELSSVLASVRGAEYVNENRLAAAEDELYSIFDDIESREDLTPEQKGQMQAAVERSIQTLQDYGFRTRTETRTATQAVAVRAPKQAPKAARRGATPIAAAADEGISITYDDGVSGPKQGVVKKENGQYVFYQKPMGAVKKFKPVVIGDAAIVDGSVQFAGIENRTTGPLASVANITLPGGKKITILDDDLSIDAAIHVAKLELGEIPQDEFDIEFQTIVTENNIEVPYIYEPKPAAKPAAKPAPKPVAEPVTVAEPKAKTVALFQKLAKLRDNLKGTTHAGTKNKTQKEIDDLLRENPKLAEVSAKFDEAVKQLEDAKKLKVRCP